MTEKAEAQAIKVFSRNLRSLLLQPPVRGRVVLGIDPAYRTGCKWCVIDTTGKLLEAGVFYPTPPRSCWVMSPGSNQRWPRILSSTVMKTVALSAAGS